MMIGSGKYDALVLLVMKEAVAKGAIVMVLDGEHGNGFSAALPPDAIARIPTVLRQVANQIESDAKALPLN
jgi:hypothetical protein